MQLLGEALMTATDIEDHQEMSAFYRSLLASEARHYASYVELASGLFPAEQVRIRLDVLAAHEADVLTRSSPAVRMHS